MINIEEHLGLVHFVVHKMHSYSMTYDDMLQEGIIGLIKAQDTYDSTKGYEFSTYAIKVIKLHLYRAISQQQNIIRIPAYFKDEYKQPISYEIDVYEDLKLFETLATDYNLEEHVLNKIESEHLYKTINKLKPKEKYVIINHYFNDKSLVEISKELKVSNQYIGELRNNALRKLKEFL